MKRFYAVLSIFMAVCLLLTLVVSLNAAWQPVNTAGQDSIILQAEDENSQGQDSAGDEENPGRPGPGDNIMVATTTPEGQTVYVKYSERSNSVKNGVQLTGDRAFDIRALRQGESNNGIKPAVEPRSIMDGSNKLVKLENSAEASGQDNTVETNTSNSNAPGLTLPGDGAISGRVTRSEDASAIEDATVYAIQIGGGFGLGLINTDSDGYYTMTSLPAGSYKVYAEFEGYVKEYYNGVYTATSSTPVAVAASITTSNINFVLDLPGSITGYIRQANGVTPIQGATVLADAEEGISYGNATSDSLGKYTITGLNPGQYTVYAHATNFASEYYNEASTLVDADPVSVTVGNTTENINFTLDQPGAISGFVYQSDNSTAIVGATVEALSAEGLDLGHATTAAGGSYTISGLDPGQYKVYAHAEGYTSEYYNGAASIENANPVNVTTGSTSENINFSLEQPGAISGFVFQSDNSTAIEGATVEALSPDGSDVGWATTAVDGSYTIPGLDPGQYRVFAQATNYASEYYNGADSIDDADPVGVTAGVTTNNINFSLDQPGAISGFVFHSDNSTAIEGASVEALSPDGSDVGWATTAADGSYTIPGLDPGQYKVYAHAEGYTSEYYNGASSMDDADPVGVTAGITTQNINFSLDQPGAISGFVFQSDNSTPISGANVQAWSQSALDSGFAVSTGNGSYTITGLNPGQYQVSAMAAGYITEYYDGTSSFEDATPVDVTVGNTTAGINFSLDQPGSISGYVFGVDGSTPILNAEVHAEPLEGSSYEDAKSDSQGKYTVTGLEPGQYRVYVEAEGYVSQYYDGVIDFEEAKTVNVAAGIETTGISFTLVEAGSISGKVFKSDGTTIISDAWVYAELTDGSYGMDASTDESGSYTIEDLPSGQYRVYASASGYLTEYYLEVDNEDEAAPVGVTAPGDTPGINFTLQVGGSISGKVFQSDGATAVSGASVYAATVDGNYYGDGDTTAADGSYTLSNLRSGEYLVSVEKDGYCDEYYNAVHFSSLGTLVPVTAPVDTPNINFNLDVGGGISGKIFQADGTTPIIGASVSVYDLALNWIGSAVSEAEGVYSFTNILPTGKFRIGASAAGYAFKYYDSYIASRATPIAVTMPNVTPNINLSLDPAASISGHVYKADGTTALRWALVVASSEDGSVSTATSSNASGAFSLNAVHAGKYVVYANYEDCIVEWYKTGGNTHDNTQATVITLASSQSLANIDFSLDPGGAISGKVFKTDGTTALKGAEVMSDLANTFGGWDNTGSDGSYKLTGLPPGQYTVYAYTTGYQKEYYNNSATSGSAAKVTVSGTATTPDINFTLATGGTISGRIYQADGMIPLEYASVLVYDAANKFVSSCSTIWNGTYQTSGLAAGSYKVEAMDYAFLSRWYNGTYSQSKASAVSVTLNADHSGIDVHLEVNASSEEDLPPDITTTSLPDGYYKSPYSQQLYATQGTTPYTWKISSGKLPAGLKLSTSGVIAGSPSKKPSAVTPYTFTVLVTDANKLTDPQLLTINVHPPMTITGSKPPEAEVGAEYKGWTPGVIEGTAPYTWSLAPNKGVPPSGLAQNPSTGAITGTPNEILKSKKTFSFTVMVTDSLGGSTTLKVSIAVYPAITFTTTTLTAGEINITYKKQTLKATGGNKKYTWEFKSTAPDGLTISGNIIDKGTPTVAGKYTLTFEVKDGLGITTKDLELTVYPSPSIKAQTLPDGIINTAYYPEIPVTLALNDGCAPAKTWALEKGYKLPAGLKLDSKKGIISGKPTKAGTFNFQVKCTDNLGGACAPAGFTITIN